MPQTHEPCIWPVRTVGRLLRVSLALLFVCALVASHSVAFASAGIDVAKPQSVASAPKLLGSIQGSVSKIVVRGNLVYVNDSTQTAGSLTVLDNSDPAQLRRITSLSFEGPAVGLVVSGTQAYTVVKPSQKPSQLSVIDLTNPVSPTLQRSFQLPNISVQDVQVAGDLIGLQTGQGLIIYRMMSDGSFISVDVTPTTSLPFFTHIQGTHYYINSTSGTAQLFDASDPANVQPVSPPSYLSGPLDVAGSLVYSASQGKLKIIDYRDALHPQDIAQITVPDSIQKVHVIGSLVYLAAGAAGLIVVDISTPSHPRWLAKYDTPGTGADVEVVNKLAYVVDGDVGLQVIDIGPAATTTPLGGLPFPLTYSELVSTDGATTYEVDSIFDPVKFVFDSNLRVLDTSEPTHIVERGRYETDYETTDLVVDSGMVYMIGGSAGTASGLHIIDARNPAAITPRGSFQPAVWGLQTVDVHGSFAYVDELNSFDVIDIADPAKPTLRNSMTFTDTVNGIRVVGSLAYVTVNNNGLQIIDVSDPSHLVIRGSVAVPAGAGRLRVYGNYAYLAGGSGLSIVDVHDPANPVLLSNYRSPGGSGDVDVAGDRAYILDTTYGLQVLDIQDRTRPTLLTSATGTQVPHRIQIVDNRAYLTAGPEGLQIQDIRGPAPPVRKGSYDTVGVVVDVQVRGSLAYVATWSGMAIVDIQDPRRMRRLGGYFLSNGTSGATALQVVGKFVYLVGVQGGMVIIDVQDPHNPALVGSAGITGPPSGIQVVDNRAYISYMYSGFMIVDVSDPTKPTRRGSFDAKGSQTIAVSGSVAYLIGGDTDLYLVDVRNIDNPVLLGTYKNHGDGYDVAIAGSLAFLSTRKYGLEIVDVQNPAAPVQIGHYDLSPGIRVIQVFNQRAYFVDLSGNLIVLDVQDPIHPALLSGPLSGFGYATGLRVVGNMIYVIDLFAGLDVYWYGLPATSTVANAGGTLGPTNDGTLYMFPAGTFNDPSLVNYTPCYPGDLPSTGTLTAYDHCFDIDATSQATGQPVSPSVPYTVQVTLSERERAAANDVDLGLYWWNGSVWMKEQDSAIDLVAGTIIAHPNHFSLWSVLGAPKVAHPVQPVYHAYLPTIMH